MKTIKFLHYLFMHKYYVFKECVRFGIFWRGVVHDASKFSKEEFRWHVKRYSNKQHDTPEWRKARKHHMEHNDHHYEYWVHNGVPMEMPEEAIKEMVADWIGAGKAGKNIPVLEWYQQKKHTIPLAPGTRNYVELLLNIAL